LRGWRILCTVLCLMVVCFSLVSCTKVAKAPLASAEPVSGGKLVVGIGGGVVHLDVQSVNFSAIAQATQYVYEQLFERTATGVVPWLAKSYEISDDGLTLSLNLQEGVSFHDGTLFNAEAAKFSLQRKIDLKKPLYDLLSPIASIEVTGEYELTLHLTRPAPHLIPTLAAKTFAMYSPKWVAEKSTQTGAQEAAAGVDQGLANEAVGTGPYVLESFVSDSVVKLKKNANYWRQGYPYLDEIELRVVTDPSAGAMQLEAGDLDVLLLVSSIDLKRYSDQPDLGIKVQRFDTAAQYNVALNCTKPPLDNPRVRQALNYAIDKEGIISTVFLGFGATMAEAPLTTPVVQGYRPIGHYAYDPDKAKSLLREAGYEPGANDILYKNGQPLTLDFSTTVGRRPGDLQTAEIIKANLRAVGVNVRLTQIETATFIWEINRSPEQAHQHLLMLYSGSSNADLSYNLNSWFASSRWAPVGYNYSYYKNDKVDQLIAQGNEQPTFETRNPIYNEALSIVFDDAPIIQLFNATTSMAYGQHVGGIAPDMVGYDPTLSLMSLKFAWTTKTGE